MHCVENSQVVIVVGQTGCGKTTRTSRSSFVPRTTSNLSQKSHNIYTRAVGLLVVGS
jgi:ABC-type nitrate/sulfonate/bicarbonate transport system ATPase subunit